MHFRLFSYLLSILIPLCVWLCGSGHGMVRSGLVSVGPFGGDVRSLLRDAIHPETIYLGTSNGMIFKSADSGKSWLPLYPGIGRQGLVIDTLVQHPRDPHHLYAGAWDLYSDGGGLYESKDDGNTWTRVALPKPDSAIRGLSICKGHPSFMIAGTLEGAYITADGGNKWSRVGGQDLQKAESVAIDPLDPRILYVGTWRLLYRSMDSGKSWSRMENGMPLDSDVFSIAIDPNNPETVFSSACSGVYRSTNRARNWSRLKLLPDRYTVRALIICIDPANPRRVYCGTTEGLFVSADDGKNWTRMTSSAVTVNAIQVNPENTRELLIGTEYDGVQSSMDGGLTWRESNEGFVHRQISWLRFDPSSSNVMAGLASGSGGLFSYNTENRRWATLQIAPGVRILSFLVLPQNRGYLAGTNRGLFWQAGGSKTWTKLKGLIAARTILSLECDPQNLVVYAGTDRGIYRTSVSALDFRFPPGSRFSPQVWCLAIPAIHSGPVYAGTSLGLLRSWDRGTTWSVLSSYGMPERTVIQSLAVSPAYKDRLLAGTSSGLFESRDGGIRWERAAEGSFAMNIPSVVFADESGQRIIAIDGNTGGLLHSTDAGESWSRNLPEMGSPATCLLPDPTQKSRIFVGTRFQGVYRVDIP